MKNTDPVSGRNGRKRPPLVCLACALLMIVTFASLALSSSANKSSTFDEIAHLTRGYVYWKYNDYRFQDNGNLPDRLAALPVVMGDYKFPPLDNQEWRKSKLGSVGQTFSFRCGNDFQSMILLGRLVIICIGCCLGVTIWMWSRKLFGEAGGLISLALFALSPSMIANSRCITSDITVGLMFLLSVLAFWTTLHRIAPLTLAFSCLAAGGLFVSKMSAFLILPIVVILVVVNLLAGQPLKIAWRKTVEIKSRLHKTGIFCGLIVIHAAAVVLVIWAFFGFRFEAFRAGRGPDEQFPGGRANLLEPGTPLGETIEFCRDHRLLPESYLYSMSHVLHRAEQRDNYFFGRVDSKGSIWFFPYTYVAKMPEGTFAIFLLAVVAALAGRGKKNTDPNDSTETGPSRLYGTAPLWALIFVYWGFAVCGSINIGHRHLIPACLPAFILAGAAGRWFERPAWAMRIVVLICLAGTLAASILIWPNYLSYFNTLSGGPSVARFAVVDSSLDWGQDLPALRSYLAEHRKADQEVYLTYFGTADPGAYGIDDVRLMGGFDGLPGHPALRMHPLRPGIYCVSATLLQGAYLPKVQGDYRELKNKYDLGYDREVPLELMINSEGRQKFALLRFVRFMAGLRNRPPDGRAGYSIFIYHLTDSDIREALENG